MKVSFDLLCLDEHDSPNLSELRGKKRKEIKSVPNHRHFGICGVIIPGATYSDIKLEGMRIQEKCFGKGVFKPFHYVEILNNSASYAFLGANLRKRQSLITLLQNYLHKSKFKIIACFIDKHLLALKHGIYYKGILSEISKIKPGLSSKSTPRKINLYLICLKYILKTYYDYLNKRKKKGIIIAESRGEREDTDLLKAFYYYQKLGISNISAKELRSHIIDLLIIHKKQNHLGCQIADLVTYPIYDYEIPNHNKRNDHLFMRKELQGKLLSLNILP